MTRRERERRKEAIRQAERGRREWNKKHKGVAEIRKDKKEALATERNERKRKKIERKMRREEERLRRKEQREELRLQKLIESVKDVK